MLRKLKWQIPGEPLAARYSLCQGPVPDRGPAVEKHCSNKLTQDYLIPSALWDPVALKIGGVIVLWVHVNLINYSVLGRNVETETSLEGRPPLQEQ